MHAIARNRHGAKEVFFALVALLSANEVQAAEKPSTVRSRAPAAEVRQQILERVPDTADSISVERSGDRVVLSGTVDHLSQRWLAQEAAQDVRGVQEVVNRIQISAPVLDDAKIRQDVFWALKSDPATMALGVDVLVRDGVVTLRGAVDTVPQKRIAEWVASDRIGVRDVVNEIRVAPERRTDREIYNDLLAHYATDPLFNDDEIDVQVYDAIVGLSGHVDTAREKNWAREDAWVRGVRQVNANELGINHEPSLSTVPKKAPTDTDIRRAILRAYAYDPRVASVNTRVTVEDGVVSLDGKVSNLRARRAALRIARNTGGVREVVDRLQVETGAAQSNAEIAGSIRAALRTSAALARNSIDVSVTDGRVVLAGAVDSPYEHWLAADLAERAAGVVDLDNRTRIKGAVGRAVSPEFFPRGGAATPWTFGRPPPVAGKQ